MNISYVDVYKDKLMFVNFKTESIKKVIEKENGNHFPGDYDDIKQICEKHVIKYTCNLERIMGMAFQLNQLKTVRRRLSLIRIFYWCRHLSHQRCCARKIDAFTLFCLLRFWKSENNNKQSTIPKDVILHSFMVNTIAETLTRLFLQRRRMI
jgi:hypothetical protein